MYSLIQSIGAASESFCRIFTGKTAQNCQMDGFPVQFGKFRNCSVQHFQIRIMILRYGFQNLQVIVFPMIPHPFPQQIIADRNNNPLNPGRKSSRIAVKTGAFFPCPD